MARRIPFAEPQNQSERWAFDYLEQRLPDEIEFLTNIEVLSETGQPFEVDAIVLAPWAIHFIDVKGYRGEVRIAKDVWELDGRPVENPLPKANQVARMFAGRMRRRADRSIHLPWCQGGAFLTGHNGGGITLVKDEPALCAWGPDGIVDALVSENSVTSPSRYPVAPEQWALARDVAGQTEAVLRRQNRIGDFHKTRRIHGRQGLEIWRAEYRRGDYTRRFLLKILDPAGFESAMLAERAVADLRTEAGLYMELSGLAGIPYVAPLIDTGELLALPIRLPRGKPLAQWDCAELSPEFRLKVLRSAGAALQGIHNRELCHGRLKPASVFITDSGEVELLDIGGRAGDAAADRAALAEAFEPWFDDAQPRIRNWIESEFHDLEALRAAVLLSLDPAARDTAALAPVVLESGAVVADHFRLLEEYRRDGAVSMWRARHRLGRFDCALLITEQGEEGLQRVRSEFELLSRVFHPNVCRVFEAGSIDESRHFIARAWADGRSLRGLIADGGALGPEQLIGIARQAAAALQYLHAAGITHRNIRPASMILNEDALTLIDLGVSDPDDAHSGFLAFRDPRVADTGWNEQADLYALALTLLCAASGSAEPPLRSFSGWRDFCGSAIARLPGELQEGADAAMSLFPAGLPEDYLECFGLGEEEEPLRELPAEFRERWGISTGYMEFLVVDMLNDGRTRSRNQLVLRALRSRKIPGNKLNRSSMNATVSRLLAAGIAEKRGKKSVRLSKLFLDDWASPMEADDDS